MPLPPIAPMHHSPSSLESRIRIDPHIIIIIIIIISVVIIDVIDVIDVIVVVVVVELFIIMHPVVDPVVAFVAMMHALDRAPAIVADDLRAAQLAQAAQ
jgi:hypothetical protein